MAKYKFHDMQQKMFGDGIIYRRNIRNWALEKLAQESCLSEECLSLLEEGHEPEVSKEIIMKLAVVLGLRTKGRLTFEDALRFFLDHPRGCEQKKRLLDD